MYTDILNLLTEFDAKSSQKAGKIVDQLPKVCLACYVYAYISASVFASVFVYVSTCSTHIHAVFLLIDRLWWLVIKVLERLVC